jgi:hypothetical protein
MIIVYLTTVIVVLAIVGFRFNNFQTFKSPPKTVWVTNYANHAAWVNRAGRGEWLAQEVTTDNQSNIFNPSPNSLIVNYVNDNGKMRSGTVLEEQKGYFISISTKEFAFKRDCGFNLGGLKVGYFDRADLQFIEALIQGYRMDTDQIQLVELSPTKDVITTLGTILNNGYIDMILTYVIPKSTFHRLLQSQNISIMGFKGIDIERVKVFMPEVGIEELKLKTMFFDIGGTAAAVMDRENDTRLPTMVSKLIRISAPTQPKSILDAFTNNFEFNPASINPAFRCYGDDTQGIRQLCESKYDAIGMPKDAETVWDMPCTDDGDCPFWDYTQKRGGCQNDGACELPVAVKRVGYRRYDDTGVYAPFTRDGKLIFASK